MVIALALAGAVGFFALIRYIRALIFYIDASRAYASISSGLSEYEVGLYDTYFEMAREDLFLDPLYPFDFTSPAQVCPKLAQLLKG